MRKLTSNQWFVLTLWLVLLMLSGATFTINNEDYSRSINFFLDRIPFQDPSMPLSWQMKTHFTPQWQAYWFNPYNVILYSYASVLSLLTSWFDLMIMASILKLLYLVELFLLSKVFLNYKKPYHYFLFILLIVPLCSSSILAFLASFYTDMVVVVILPILCYVLVKPVRYSTLSIFVCVLIISSSKSQFFYFPIIVFLSLLIFDRPFNKKQALVLTLCLVMSVVSMLSISGSANLNKYHANYFGSYLFQQNNNIPLDKDADPSCVGIDIWQSKWDLKLGAIPAPPHNNCYERHHAEVTFYKPLYFFLENPLLLASLSFDKGIQHQMTEDYFSMRYVNKYIVSQDALITYVTQLKDDIFKPWRFLISFLITLTSIFLYRVPNAKLLFILGGFSSSQFYVTFFGEGYRDMSRHLFAMNFSFDLLIFVSLLMIIEGIHTLQKSQRASQ
ncbi:hypothetical protein GA565_12470 [Rouxiella sp. S1S-2]|uniref:hypothetical protein n=1 Tax=Rouxiella sp. S1S-2 TaxID=2653856 RepID=UPI001264901F|nr:hypothetical protein [Rouxiella sp. S1S-2]KAB7896724.1 hypothetical protein GA565_12470 [Rouxiella sp. S1S-2]